MVTPIICLACGATGSVNRVTASLKCACGSDDLDIFDGQTVEASKQGPKKSKTGWDEQLPPQGTDGEYVGPPVGPNPNILRNNDAGYPGSEEAYTRGNPGYIPGGGYDLKHLPVGPFVPPIETYDAHVPTPGAGSAQWSGRRAVKDVKVTPKGGNSERLLKMMAAISENNTGLSEQTIFTLAKRAVEAHPEA